MKIYIFLMALVITLSSHANVYSDMEITSNKLNFYNEKIKEFSSKIEIANTNKNVEEHLDLSCQKRKLTIEFIEFLKVATSEKEINKIQKYDSNLAQQTKYYLTITKNNWQRELSYEDKIIRENLNMKIQTFTLETLCKIYEY